MPGHIICGPNSVSNDEIKNQARRAAAGFRAIGAEGGCVATLLRNDSPFVTVTEAARMVGAISVPINWHFSAAEIAYVLEDCAASVLVAHSDIWAQIGPQLPRELVDRLTVICVETPQYMLKAHRRSLDSAVLSDDVREWAKFCLAYSPIEETPQGTTFPVVYTSGTTGNPKGVLRKGRAAPSKDHSYDAFFGPDMVTLLAAPLYHSAPQRFCSGTFSEGGTLVLPPRFDAEETLALIERYGVTDSFMVPTMVTRMLRLPEETRNKYDLSSLRHVVFAGAPFPPEIKAQLIDWWGPVVYEYYGSTETGAITFATPEDAVNKPGSVGKVLPIARLQILDDARRPLPAGEVGEIYGCRSDYPDFEYLNRPEDRKEIGHDGMVTAGDVGYLDDEGYLFLSDRKRDMIIAGGVNIYPAHIEAALLAHPVVLDAAVFGVPDPDLGEAIVAAIETVDGATPDFDELRSYLLGKIAKYMVPKQFTHEAALPRDEAGKLKKRVLRDPYWEGQARAI